MEREELIFIEHLVPDGHYTWYIMSSHLSHNITHKDTAYLHCIGNENETEA